MTEKIYFQDAYLKEETARVLAVIEEGIILDRTLFFGKACGVKTDTGYIFFGLNKSKVLSQKTIKNNVVHIIEGEIPEINAQVKMVLDWGRRYMMMKYHTSLHIISSIIWKRFGVLATGSDITPDKAKIDFDFERNLTKDELKEVEDSINLVIEEDHKTSSFTMPLDKALQTDGIIRTKSNILPKGLQEIRIVKIGTVDQQADGGIHVKSTSEIGEVKIIKHKNKGKGRRRIEICIM